MAIWTNIVKMFRSRVEPISQEDLAKYLGGEEIWTGLDVDRYTALGLPIVWACVRVLAETLASLPIILYKRIEGGKERAEEHPLYPILHIQPNPDQTSFIFKEQLQGHLGIFGNAYAQIVRDGRGYIKELWPLDPSRVTPDRSGGTLRFIYKESGKAADTVLARENVLYIPGLSFDGIRGYAPLEINRQTLGLALAAKRYSAEFFANDATPTIALVSPGKLSDEASKRMGDSWKTAHGKWGKKHTPAILEQGTEIKQLSLDPDKVQLVEIQKFLTREVCRFYRMQPHLVQDLENATFTNIEQQSLEFVIHTMRPWLIRWEQAITTQLLSERDRKEYFAEFLIDALLRGDIVARATAYRTFIEIGVLNADEVREMENKNKREGGDTYYAPQNWQATSGSGLEQQNEKDELAREQMQAQMDAKAQAAPAQPAQEPAQRSLSAPESRAARSANSRRKLANAFDGLIRDTVSRIVRKEQRDIRVAVSDYVTQRDLGDLNLWLDKYYTGLPDYIKKQITPVYQTFSNAVKKEIAEEIGISDESTEEDEKFVRSMADVFVKAYIGTSLGNLDASIKAAIDAGAPLDAAIEERLVEWEQKRPEKVSRKEKVGVSNAVARNLYALAGITTLTWMAAGGDPCPFCRQMDGNTVDIKQPFAYNGEEIPEDERGLKISKSMGHPPLHAGCECQIVSSQSSRMVAAEEKRDSGDKVTVNVTQPPADPPVVTVNSAPVLNLTIDNQGVIKRAISIKRDEDGNIESLEVEQREVTNGE
jgi:HK97 family phage portal protein